VEFSIFAELNNRKPGSAMVPFEIKWEKRPGTKFLRPKKFAICPCYVFVECDGVAELIAAKAYVNDLAEAKGRRAPIVALVGYGSKPSTLAPTDVSLLKRLSAPEPSTLAIHKALGVGQQATIIKGAFTGHTVKIDAIDRKKVVVLLQLLNSMQPVTIDAGSLVAA
jgi:transcription antitermination factor NusG